MLVLQCACYVTKGRRDPCGEAAWFGIQLQLGCVCGADVGIPGPLPVGVRLLCFPIWCCGVSIMAFAAFV